MSCSSRRSSCKNRDDDDDDGCENKDVPLDRSSSGSNNNSTSNSIVVMVVVDVMHFRKDHGVVLRLEKEEDTGTATSMESLDGRIIIIISWGKHSFKRMLLWGREFVVVIVVVVVVTGHSSIWGRYSYGLLFVVDV